MSFVHLVPDKECKEAIDGMKANTLQCTAIILKITKEQILLAGKVPRGKTLEDIRNDFLERDQPRFILYNKEVIQSEGAGHNFKLQLIVWCLDDYAPGSQKMLISSSTNTVKELAESDYNHWQWNDEDTVNEHIEEQKSIHSQK